MTFKIAQSGNGVEDKRVDFDYNGVNQYTQVDRISSQNSEEKLLRGINRSRHSEQDLPTTNSR